MPSNISLNPHCFLLLENYICSIITPDPYTFSASWARSLMKPLNLCIWLGQPRVIALSSDSLATAVPTNRDLSSQITPPSLVPETFTLSLKCNRMEFNTIALQQHICCTSTNTRILRIQNLNKNWPLNMNIYKPMSTYSHRRTLLTTPVPPTCTSWGWQYLNIRQRGHWLETLDETKALLWHWTSVHWQMTIK